MATVQLAPVAQEQIDSADERWTDEHGPDANNPLLAQVERATLQLADNPRLGKVMRRRKPLLYRLVEIVAVWYGGRGEAPPV
jgi:plasmid stabilization system protein ParE